MLIFLLACALHSPPDTHYVPQHPPGALSEVFSNQSEDALFDEAVARRHDGDLDGAIHRLDWLRLNGKGSAAVLYQLGIAYEMKEDYDKALAVYDMLMAEDVEGRWVLDAGFRRAMCLEDMDRWREALRQYRSLPQTQGFDRHDRYTLDLAIGIAELRVGSRRKGERLIEDALRGVSETDEITWMEAKAWYTLADLSLAEAAAIPMDVRQRRQVKNLERRAGHIAQAERHLIRVVELAEPEWIMRGMLSLGDGYHQLYLDLQAVPAPKDLTPEQVQLYRQTLDSQTGVLLRKSWEAYDQGLVVAGKFGVENGTRRRLLERRDALGI